MALSILDGTQTATTLSTILSSGQHITAHTVVSLGTQAITDILNATSAGLTNTQLRASAVTIGGTVTVGNSVTISSLPAISGTVTANVPLVNIQPTVSEAIPVVLITDEGKSVFDVNQSIQASITSALPAGTAQIGSVTASISGTVPISISSVTIGNSVTIGSLPAISGVVTANIGNISSIIGAGYNDLFSLGDEGNLFVQANVTNFPATQVISGTVTANLSISATAITSGSFASLTSATLVPGNTARKMATVYNLGAGQLFVQAGATATTLGGGFMVALSSGDYFECGFTTTTLSALFATAGTASWVSH